MFTTFSVPPSVACLRPPSLKEHYKRPRSSCLLFPTSGSLRHDSSSIRLLLLDRHVR